MKSKIENSQLAICNWALLLCFLCALLLTNLSAQNVAIRPLLAEPLHEFNAIPGCPTNWPVIVDRLGSNTISPFPGRTILTEDDLAALYRSIGPAFTNWHQGAWANYNATNAAALDARRLILETQRQAILSRIETLTNSSDFTTVMAPLIVSNLVRLRLLEENISRSR